MIEITPSIWLDESEIQLVFIRSSGPGGQNVNKVATGVQLRFDLAASESLPDDVKKRLEGLARSRITDDGTMIIEAKRHRTQEQNRQDAFDRLVELIRRATEPPRPRYKTRPTAASIEKRLEIKRRRSTLKRLRRNKNLPEY